MNEIINWQNKKISGAINLQEILRKKSIFEKKVKNENNTIEYT
jgi:hypothetical protein